MKIVICSISYPPSLWNSVGRTTYSLSQGLQLLGHTVTVVTYNPALGDKFAKDKGVRIQYLGTDGNATLSLDQIRAWQDKVRDYLRIYEKSCERFICIDSYGYKAIEESHLKAPVISLCNFFYTCTGWLNTIGTDREVNIIKEELAFVTNSSVVLANNKVTKKQIEHKSNRTCETYTIGIPVITDYAYTPKKRQVLYVGKLNREKGIERILRVMPKLTWMKLILCDQNTNNSYKAIINKLAAELKVDDRIEYTEFLTTQQVWKLYTESEICIVPHITEPFGYSAIYPMMLGTPTIVSIANSLPEIVGDNGDCGAIARNIEDFRFYLEELHSMLDLAIMYSKNGREKILQERSLAIMVGSVAKYL
jgi:glycosyltransferase involved in cell wall biosynthesis